MTLRPPARGACGARCACALCHSDRIGAWAPVPAPVAAAPRASADAVLAFNLATLATWGADEDGLTVADHVDENGRCLHLDCFDLGDECSMCGRTMAEGDV